MFHRPTAAIAFLLVVAWALPAGQEAPSREPARTPEPLFVRLTFYPTASLSRYDYNNDLDLYEVRAYAEIRRGSQDGPVVTDAVVTAAGEKLVYGADLYEKRIIVDKDRRPEEILVEIAVKDRPGIKESFPLPAWLLLEEPRPAVLEADSAMDIRWRFSRFQAPVEVHAYDFKTGHEFFRSDFAVGTSATVPAGRLPSGTIVRVYILQSWLYKRFLAGTAYARGSEVNVIPWSQVFVRTR